MKSTALCNVNVSVNSSLHLDALDTASVAIATAEESVAVAASNVEKIFGSKALEAVNAAAAAVKEGKRALSNVTGRQLVNRSYALLCVFALDPRVEAELYALVAAARKASGKTFNAYDVRDIRTFFVGKKGEAAAAAPMKEWKAFLRGEWVAPERIALTAAGKKAIESVSEVKFEAPAKREKKVYTHEEKVKAFMKMLDMSYAAAEQLVSIHENA